MESLRTSRIRMATASASARSIWSAATAAAAWYARRSASAWSAPRRSPTPPTYLPLPRAGRPARQGRAYRFIILGPEGTWSTIVAINGTDQWRFSIIGGNEPHEYTTDEINALIRRAVGRDFDYEILTVMPWVRRELVAERYGDGRVYMAGDAVHMLSPTGAFGMNTGIQDAVDLSWKLAAVLQGFGGPDLLASYDAERRPIGHRNVREAAANFRRMTSPRPGPLILDPAPEGDLFRQKLGAEFAEIMRHEWFTLGVHLGYRYIDSPICCPDGTPPPPDEPNRYVPSACPGCRAPHVGLSPGRSTLDLFGKGFALLGFGADAADVDALMAAARTRGVPLAFTPIDHAEAAALYARKLVLVRPDGHVAWRGDRAPDNALAVIDRDARRRSAYREVVAVRRICARRR